MCTLLSYLFSGSYFHPVSIYVQQTSSITILGSVVNDFVAFVPVFEEVTCKGAHYNRLTVTNGGKVTIPAGLLTIGLHYICYSASNATADNECILLLMYLYINKIICSTVITQFCRSAAIQVNHPLIASNV